MATITLAPNLESIIAQNVVLRARIALLANQILALAKQLVPVRSGSLQESGRVEFGLDGDIVTAKVIFGGGDVDYAVYVEFGTSDTPTFAFLRRAGEAYGG